MGRNSMLNRTIIGHTHRGTPVFAIAGGADDDPTPTEKSVQEPAANSGGGGEPEVDDDGYMRVSKEAWDNIKGAADRSKDTGVEAEKLRRENAILKSVPGANLDDDRVKNLVNSNLDNDTVVQMVEALTTPGDPSKPAEPEIGDDERGQTRERTGLAAGADPGGQDDPNKPGPHEEALTAHQQHVDAGGTREDAFAIAIGTVMASEDPRAFVAPEFRENIDDYMRAARG